MPEPRIALVTYADAPDLTPDDQLLVPALASLGMDGVAVRWDDPAVDWAGFRLVVLRATWDYFTRADEFAAWIDRLELDGVPLANPAAVVRWNADKRYLLELEADGVPIIATRLIEPGTPESLAAVMNAAGWRDAVVKPAVSGGAFETWRVSAPPAPDDESRAARLLAEGRALLVQPFVPEIVADGEWSLLYFAGAYSHAAIKRAAAGDFRVQQQYGGIYSPVAAHPQVVSQGAQVVAAAAARLGLAPDDMLYARVDGAVVNGVLQLMELELIEPALFFRQAPESAARFAQCVARATRAAAPSS